MITLKNSMLNTQINTKTLRKNSSMSSTVHTSSFKNKSKVPSIPNDNNSYILNNFEKPLTSDLAFKGFSLSGIAKEFTRLSKDPLVYEESFIKTAREIYGKALDGKIFDEAINSFRKEGTSTIEIERKTLLAELIDNVIYPVKDFPKDIANFVIDTMPGIKNNKELKQTLRPEGSWLDKHIKKTEKDKNMASLTGLFEKIEKLANKGNDEIVKALRKDSHKEMDPTKGNYNTSAERFMARWVSGMMSAIFLATDTYNLSRLVKDDHKNANKERKTRFAQEVGRVGFAAYLTLVLTGTFKKASNKSIGNALFLTGIATLAAEVIGRKIAGKDIMPISKEKAIKLANEENKGSKQEQKMSAVAFNNASSTTYAQTKNVFDKLHNSSQKVSFTSSEKTEIKEENKKTNKWLKILAGYVGLSAVAIVLHNSKTFQNIVKLSTEGLQKQYNKLYERWTNKVEQAPKKEFEQFINELKSDNNNGLKGLAEDYEKAVKDYRKELAKTEKNLDENSVYIGKSTNFKAKGIMDSFLAFPFRFIKKTFLLPQTLTEFAAKWKKIEFSNPTELKKAVNMEEAAFVKLIKKNLSGKELNEVNKELIEFIKKEHSSNPEVMSLLKDSKKSNIEMSETIKEVKNLLSEENKQNIDAKINELELKHIADSKLNKAILENTPEPDEIKKLNESLDRVQKGFKTFQNIKNKVKEANKNATESEIIEKTKAQFSNKNLHSFDTTNVSSYDSSQLGTLTKFLCSGITGFFLISDSFNLVMQKSKGENKDLARQKANERGVQEVSRNLFSTYFVKGFNDTFKVLYNKSLAGAALITATNVFLYELVTRKAVGLPVTGKSRDEILNKEKENLNKKGFWGKYYRAMSYLTGKSSLSSRIKKPQDSQQQPQLEIAAFMANCKKAS